MKATVKKKKKVENVTIGVHKDVYDKLDKLRVERERELGGIKLSWTDYFQTLLKELDGGKK